MRMNFNDDPLQSLTILSSPKNTLCKQIYYLRNHL